MELSANRAFKRGNRESRVYSDNKKKRYSRYQDKPNLAEQYDQYVLDVKPVNKVIRGGKLQRFSVITAIGRYGNLGVGYGKARTVRDAVDKSVRDAHKNIITDLPITSDHTIPISSDVKYNTVRLIIKPRKNLGFVCGSVARPMLKLAGYRKITAKFPNGTGKSRLNAIGAVYKALKELKRRYNIVKKRDINEKIVANE